MATGGRTTRAFARGTNPLHETVRRNNNGRKDAVQDAYLLLAVSSKFDKHVIGKIISAPPLTPLQYVLRYGSQLRFDARGGVYKDPLESFNNERRIVQVEAKLNETKSSIQEMRKKQRAGRCQSLPRARGHHNHHHHHQDLHPVGGAKSSMDVGHVPSEESHRTRAGQDQPRVKRAESVVTCATSSRRVEDSGMKMARYQPIESSGKQTAHNLRPWIDLKDDRYNTEHKFPHVYTGFGVPSKLKVTATGPLRNAPPYVTTSQESWKWEEPDPDVYLQRGHFNEKGTFTEFLRESIRKHVNLKKTAH